MVGSSSPRTDGAWTGSWRGTEPPIAQGACPRQPPHFDIPPLNTCRGPFLYVRLFRACVKKIEFPLGY